MNSFAAKKIYDQTQVDPKQVPTVLDSYANTASVGSIIVLYQYKADMGKGN